MDMNKETLKRMRQMRLLGMYSAFKSSLEDLSFVRESRDLFITGSTGTGKSYIATALGMKACQKGMRVMYANTYRLMGKLKLAKAKGDIIKELKRIEKTDVLIMEDFCMHPFDAGSRMSLMDIRGCTPSCWAGSLCQLAVSSQLYPTEDTYVTEHPELIWSNGKSVQKEMLPMQDCWPGKGGLSSIWEPDMEAEPFSGKTPTMLGHRFHQPLFQAFP